MLSAIILNVIKLSVVMLNAIMVRVVSPFFRNEINKTTLPFASFHATANQYIWFFDYSPRRVEFTTLTLRISYEHSFP
jgi:hypothetical protein